MGFGEIARSLRHRRKCFIYSLCFWHHHRIACIEFAPYGNGWLYLYLKSKMSPIITGPACGDYRLSTTRNTNASASMFETPNRADNHAVKRC
jgi:hypothetical protein